MEGFHQEYGVQNYDNGVEFWFTLDRKSCKKYNKNKWQQIALDVLFLGYTKSM